MSKTNLYLIFLTAFVFLQTAAIVVLFISLSEHEVIIESHKEGLIAIAEEQNKLRDGIVTSLDYSKDVRNSTQNLRDWVDKISTMEGQILIKN